MVLARVKMDWEDCARRILRIELARAGVSYKELSRRLEALGVVETHMNLSNKVARGRFSFEFFLKCMRALNVRSVELSEIYAPLQTNSGNQSLEPEASGPQMES